MKEIKLKRCSFCGGEAKIKTKIKPYFTIGCECIECGAKTVGYCPNLESENALASIEQSKEMVIEKWNTRKPMQEIVERLEKKINPLHNVNWNSAIEEAIEIVKEVGGMNE